MAPKRPAKKAAAPKRAAKKAAARLPSPLPPAESSDETRSGSRSRSDHSEDEDATADSPVPAPTPTPTLKNTPAPSQKGGESESSEEEEDDDEEEEPVRAPPRNQPPPPQKKEDSDASGSDEEDEEEEEPARAAAPPPSALKKQPPQPQNKEDSDTSGDEEDEDEEEEAPPKPAPKKEAEASKPPAAAAETKKPGAVQRIWSTDDEVRILKALAAHQKEHGTLPQRDALLDFFAGKLDNPSYGSKELYSKVGSLRTRYLTLSKRGELPSKEHDRQLLDLSKMVWDSDKTTPAAAAAAAAANGTERKGFEEMCELYPYLAEEVKELEAARPGMCKREFGKMDDDKARAMDEKIKRQRVAQIRLEMRRSDLAKEVIKALVDLVDG